VDEWLKVILGLTVFVVILGVLIWLGVLLVIQWAIAPKHVRAIDAEPVEYGYVEGMTYDTETGEVFDLPHRGVHFE
jgi:hypothetical protein